VIDFVYESSFTRGYGDDCDEEEKDVEMAKHQEEKENEEKSDEKKEDAFFNSTWRNKPFYGTSDRKINQ